VTEPVEGALVRSLDEAELRRALATADAALDQELERSAAEVVAALRPMLEEVAAMTPAS
jgi:hypothetical protein